MANDMTIIAGIVSFFLLLGFATPFINAEFNTSYSSYSLSDDQITGSNINITNVNDTSGLFDTEVNVFTGDVNVGIIDVLFSVVTIFFWTFGGIPAFLDVILIVPRLILILTIARNIWIGGGG